MSNAARQRLESDYQQALAEIQVLANRGSFNGKGLSKAQVRMLCSFASKRLAARLYPESYSKEMSVTGASTTPQTALHRLLKAKLIQDIPSPSNFCRKYALSRNGRYLVQGLRKMATRRIRKKRASRLQDVS